MEVVVIAGMRYDTIYRILMKGDKQLKHYKQIILQCSARVEDMRRWPHQDSFTIDTGQLVKDHHYYKMLSAYKEPSDMRGDQYLFGVYLDRHPLFKECWTYILGKQEIIMQRAQPRHNRHAAAIEKIKTTRKKLKELD